MDNCEYLTVKDCLIGVQLRLTLIYSGYGPWGGLNVWHTNNWTAEHVTAVKSIFVRMFINIGCLT